MPQEQGRIVLVTSAFYMLRAQQVFAAQGLMGHLHSVDFRATYKQASLLDFLPKAEAFEETSLFVYEIIGCVYYRLKYPDQSRRLDPRRTLISTLRPLHH